MLSPLNLTTHDSASTINDGSAAALKWWRIALIGVLVCFISAISIVIWGLNRGFELRDEGFALLQAESPASYPFTSSFHFITSRLPCLLANPICNLRLMHLLFSLLSSGLLGLATCNALGFNRNASCEGTDLSLLNQKNVQLKRPVIRCAVMIITLVCCLASLLSFSTVEFSLSYHSLTASILFTASALLLVAVSSERFLAPLLIGAGALTSLAFFVKLPASLAFAALAIFLLLGPGGMRVVVLRHFLLGQFVGVLGFFLLVEPVEVWIRQFWFSLSVDLGGDHTPLFLLSQTWASCLKHGAEISVTFAALTAGAIMLALDKKLVARTFPRVRAVVMVALILVLGAESMKRGYLHSGIVYAPLLFLLIDAVQVYYVHGSRRSNRYLFGVIVFLLLLPFACSIGTNSPILWHAIGNSSSLVVAYIVLALFIGAENSNSVYAPLVVLITAGITLAQIVYGYLLMPHGIASLLEQTLPVNSIERLRGVVVEPSVKTLVEDSERILRTHQYEKGDPIIALCDLPGLVYLLEGVSPGQSWYHDRPDIPDQNLKDSWFLQSLSTQHFERLYVIVSNHQGLPLPNVQLLKSLHRAGIRFPEEFDQIGTTVRPFVANRQTCFIYARKQQPRSSEAAHARSFAWHELMTANYD